MQVNRRGQRCGRCGKWVEAKQGQILSVAEVEAQGMRWPRGYVGYIVFHQGCIETGNERAASAVNTGGS